MERRIKEFTLSSWTLLLHTTRLWPESVSTMLCPLYFKAEYQMYNSLEMDEDGKTLGQKFYGVEFQIFPSDYHICGCPVSILEDSLQGGPEELPK